MMYDLKNFLQKISAPRLFSERTDFSNLFLHIALVLESHYGVTIGAKDVAFI
jgi:hypothetical protein